VTIPAEIIHVAAVLVGVALDRLYLREKHKAANEALVKATRVMEYAVRAETYAQARLRAIVVPVKPIRAMERDRGRAA
jgi:hypothetical protein